MGISVDDAARRIADAAVGTVAELVGSTLARAGIDPGEAVLFAYGGNGGLFAAPVAERLSIASARVFGLGPVLSAFGSAVSDVVHVYERSLGVAAAPGRDAVVAAAADMAAAGRRDLAGEGFDPDEAETEIELDVHDGQGRRTVRAGDAGQALASLDGATHVDVVRVRVRRRLQACQPPPRTGGSQAEPTRRTLLLADGGSSAGAGARLGRPIPRQPRRGPGPRGRRQHDLPGPARLGAGSRRPR